MFNSVQHQHVQQAVAHVAGEGIPSQRNSRGWTVVINGENYPPKYLMSVARGYAEDAEPGPWDVHTYDAVSRLRQLGFDVRRLQH